MAGGTADMAARMKWPPPTEEVERPLKSNFDPGFFLSPFSIIVEYCTRSTFHTKHRPEKYAEYFQAAKQAFNERYPAIKVVGNPEEFFKGRRAFRVEDHLKPMEDVSRPRLGAFEVTLLCDRTGPRTVYSKLDSGRWPDPRALVDRAENVSRGQDALPPVVGPQDISHEEFRQIQTQPLPGATSLKVKRNLRLHQPRFKRSWDPPPAPPPQRVRDLRELSARMYRMGGPTLCRTPKSKTDFSRLVPEDGIGWPSVNVEGWPEGQEVEDAGQEEEFEEGQEPSGMAVTDEWETGFEEDPDPVAVAHISHAGGDEGAAALELRPPTGSRPQSRGSRPGSGARRYLPVAATSAGPSSAVSEPGGAATVPAARGEAEPPPSRPQEDYDFEDSHSDPALGAQASVALDAYSEFEDSHSEWHATSVHNEEELPAGQSISSTAPALPAESSAEAVTEEFAQPPKMEEKECELVISRSDNQKFGMTLLEDDNGHATVTVIRAGGRVDEWNSQNPATKIIVGDTLISVNGQTAYRELMKELKSSTEVTVRTLKLMPVEEAAAPLIDAPPSAAAQARGPPDAQVAAALREPLERQLAEEVWRPAHQQPAEVSNSTGGLAEEVWGPFHQFPADVPTSTATTGGMLSASLLGLQSGESHQASLSSQLLLSEISSRPRGRLLSDTLLGVESYNEGQASVLGVAPDPDGNNKNVNLAHSAAFSSGVTRPGVAVTTDLSGGDLLGVALSVGTVSAVDYVRNRNDDGTAPLEASDSKVAVQLEDDASYTNIAGNVAHVPFDASASGNAVSAEDDAFGNNGSNVALEPSGASASKASVSAEDHANTNSSNGGNAALEVRGGESFMPGEDLGDEPTSDGTEYRHAEANHQYDDEFIIPDSSGAEDQAYGEEFDSDFSEDGDDGGQKSHGAEYTDHFPMQRSDMGSQDYDDSEYDDDIALSLRNAADALAQDVFDADGSDEGPPLHNFTPASNHNYDYDVDSNDPESDGVEGGASLIIAGEDGEYSDEGYPTLEAGEGSSPAEVEGRRSDAESSGESEAGQHHVANSLLGVGADFGSENDADDDGDEAQDVFADGANDFEYDEDLVAEASYEDD